MNPHFLATSTSRTHRSASLAALLLAGTALACVPTAAHAQSKWNGGTSEDWFDATNWTPNGVPDASTPVTIDTSTPNDTVINTNTATANYLLVGVTATGKLTIRNGASLEVNADVDIGSDLGSSGSVTVTDAGSKLSNQHNLDVGLAGSGSLMIRDGAQVTSFFGFIGVDATGVGVVTVDGHNASWQNTVGLLDIGEAGQGTLNIRNGGSVSSPSATLGDSANSTGLLTVDGPGSSFVTTSTSNPLSVGSSGNGTVNITSQGSVTTYDAYIGRYFSSQGTVTVDGAGSAFTTQHGLYVGGSDDGEVSSGNSGSLSVTGGGLLNSSGDFVVGSSMGATGTVTVTDQGSTLTHNGDVQIGDNGGMGTVNILAKAQGSAGNVFVGDMVNSTGTMTVDGAQTKFVAAGDAIAGNSGIGTITVSGGGEFDAADLAIAYDIGSVGTVKVTDAGSSLGLAGEAAIGFNGTATLSILAGGKMADQDAVIGGSNGAGTATVSGAGSQWTTAADLTIGAQAVGTLNIQNGGKVSSDHSEIGAGPAGVGTVDISDAGSAWAIGDLIDGYDGSGTLTVEKGATATAASLDMGLAANSSGTLTVKDAGSGLGITGDATIGDAGTGTLSILAGATMTDDFAYIGETGGTGTVTVDGNGSTWNTTNDFHLGDYGNGTLTIAGGGQVTSGLTTLGLNSGVTGTATVTDAGSQWTAGEIVVGNGGTGSLSILAGGKVSTSLFGVGNQGQGSVTVSGAGSTLNNAAVLYVGYLAPGGPNTMAISNGGTVTSDSSYVGYFGQSTGGITIDGAGSSLTNTTTLEVGAAGTGTLDISNGGTATAATGIIGDAANSSGAVTIDGNGSILTFGSNLIVGRDGTGSITVSNGATLKSLPGLLLAANADSVGTLNIGADAGGPAVAAGDVRVSVIAFGDGRGAVDFNHTNSNYNFTAAMTGRGSINQIGGVTHLTADSSGFSGGTDVSGGTLFVDNNLGTAASEITVEGTLGGKGNIGGTVTVNPGGTLLGVQGQTLTMQELTLTSGANVNVTLDTPGGGALFNVVGDLDLDGTLNISTAGAFGPGIYSLFNYGGVLTDDGLDIGTTPTGTSASDFSIQSGGGKVNLVDAAQTVLNFWDGDAAGSANNNAIDGGSGVWNATNPNWTDIAGTSNGPMAPQPGFAIFETKGGTVTVDGSAGDVAVTGMQFAVDGYKVVGDSITLANPDSIIRVGDGSAAGANYTATIGSALVGTGGLDKADLGTLVLTGNNSYTGGTRVIGGTLALAGDGSIAASSFLDVQAPATFDISATNNGASIADLIGEGTINLGAQTLTLTAGQDHFDGVIAGIGGLTMTGGDEYFTGVNTYTGKTTIVGNSEFVLADGGSIAASSGVSVGQSATFDISLATAPVSIQSLSGAGGVNLGAQLLELTNASDQFDGVISGTGILLVAGGTEKLGGVNTYTGGTAIAGTLALVGNGSIAASSEVALDATGTFDISATNNGASIVSLGGDGNVVLGAQKLTLTNAAGQLTGVISGTGGLTIAAGAEKLSGINTYTGGTTIGTGASLELTGNGSIQGNVQDDGALLLNDTTNLTLGGGISGTGRIAKGGTATTTLTGVNSYTGGTVIAQGMLVGSATSFGTGAIDDEAALVLDQPADASFANVVTGTGSFTKQGAGILTLTSDSSGFVGATTVASGRLSVNGSLAGSVVTVKSGANLGGNGTVGGVVAESGATIAPGNSIGLLHVAGNYSQAAASTYQVELNPAGQSDLIDVTGTATLAPGALLAVTNTGTGAYVYGTQYKILDAAGGISGTYTLANTQISAFLGLSLAYDANDVYLDVTKTQSFASAGSTRNQTDTGAGLDSLPTSNAIVGAVVVMPDNATADAAFDQLSGEIHASAKTAMLEDSRLVRDAALGRLLGAEGRGTGLWGTYTGSWATNDGDGNAATLTRNASSFVVGVDASPAKGLTVGVLGGYAKSNARVPARNSSAKIDSYTAGFYAGADAGRAKIRIGGAYSWQNVDTNRSVAFAGFSDKLSAKYSARTAQAFGDIGYTIGSDRLNVEPFAQAAWIDVATDAFTETGGAAALKADKQSRDLGVVTLGLRGVAGFTIGGAAARFHATAGWREATGDRTPDASLSFASGGNAFDIAGAPIAKNSALLDTGIDVALTPRLRLNIGYVGQLASHTRDNGVKAGVSMAF